MATTTFNASRPSMKLLVDTKARRVLFAEASKDVVDFLSSLLDMPIATALTLVKRESVLSSASRLLVSLEKLNSTNNDQPGAVKKEPAASAGDPVLRLQAPSPELSKGFFRCHHNYRYSPGIVGSKCCSFYMTDVSGSKCPNCGSPMTAVLHYVSPAWYGSQRKKARTATGEEEATAGSAQDVVEATYMVADNLTVTPATAVSAMSTIAMLNELGVTDLAAVEEKTVRLGYLEGLKILEASLQSQTVLSDVFLGKRRD